MSKGSPMHGVRVAPAVNEQMAKEIESRNDHSREEPYGPAGFIAAAIREKLAKKKRGRSKHQRLLERQRLCAEMFPLSALRDMLS
jgi:hypothetical protein